MKKLSNINKEVLLQISIAMLLVVFMLSIIGFVAVSSYIVIDQYKENKRLKVRSVELEKSGIDISRIKLDSPILYRNGLIGDVLNSTELVDGEISYYRILARIENDGEFYRTYRKDGVSHHERDFDIIDILPPLNKAS